MLIRYWYFVLMLLFLFILDTTLTTLKAQSNDISGVISFELSPQPFIGVDSGTGRIFTKFVFDSEVCLLIMCFIFILQKTVLIRLNNNKSINQSIIHGC